MDSISTMMPLESTESEIFQQPEVVARALKNNREQISDIVQIIHQRNISSIYLVGSGDSMFLGLSIKEAFNIYAGLTLSITQAYEYAVFGDKAVNDHTAILIISSSGRVSTTREALSRALNSDALVIGITDNPSEDNPFYTEPAHVLVPGAIKNGWPTQTTTATMAVLFALAIELGRINGTLLKNDADKLTAELDQLPSLMTEVLEGSRIKMCQLAEKFVDEKTVYFIGSGPGYGVANIGGAVMAEGPQKIGVPLYVEEFHHSLRVNTIGIGMPVFLIAPNDPAYLRYIDTVNAVKSWGGYLIAIVNEDDQVVASGANCTIRIPEVPHPFSPLLTVLPIHLFSLELTQYLVDKGYQRPWYPV